MSRYDDKESTAYNIKLFNNKAADDCGNNFENMLENIEEMYGDEQQLFDFKQWLYFNTLARVWDNYECYLHNLELYTRIDQLPIHPWRDGTKATSEEWETNYSGLLLATPPNEDYYTTKHRIAYLIMRRFANLEKKVGCKE